MADLINGKTTRDVLVAGRILEVSVTSGSVGVHIIDTGLRETIQANKVYGPYNKDVRFSINPFTAVAAYTNTTLQPSDVQNSAQATSTYSSGSVGITNNGKHVDLTGAIQNLPSLDNSNVGTWFAGSTVSMSNFQSVFGGSAQGADGFGTAHMLRECAGHFDAIQLIFANGNANNDIIIEGAKVVVTDTLADLSLNSQFIAQTSQVTFGGSTKGIVPARDANVTGNGPSILVSDKFNISSVNRSDIIGALPLLAARVAFDCRQDVNPTGPSRSSTNGASYWIRGGAEWNTGGAAKLLYTCRPWGNFLNANLSGTFSTPQLANTDAVQAAFCPIFGIRFWFRNKAMTVFYTGDSIVSCDFGSSADRSYGWGPAAVQAVSTIDRPIEYCNMGIASQTSTTFTKYAMYAARLFNPTHILHWGFTPNDATIGTGTPASLQLQLDGMTANTELMRKCANDIGAKFCLVNGVPRNTNSTTSYFDSTNGLMVEKFRNALLSNNAPALDTNTSVANKTAVPYRWQMTAAGDAADFTVDFIHPNYAARQAMRVPATSFVTKLRDLSLPI